MSRVTARGLKWLTATWDGGAAPPDWYARGCAAPPPAISPPTGQGEGPMNIMAEIAIKAAQLAQHNRHQTQSSSRQPPDNNGLDAEQPQRMAGKPDDKARQSCVYTGGKVPSENFINFRLMSAMCAISLHFPSRRRVLVHAKSESGQDRQVEQDLNDFLKSVPYFWFKRTWVSPVPLHYIILFFLFFEFFLRMSHASPRVNSELIGQILIESQLHATARGN